MIKCPNSLSLCWVTHPAQGRIWALSVCLLREFVLAYSRGTYAYGEHPYSPAPLTSFIAEMPLKLKAMENRNNSLFYFIRLLNARTHCIENLATLFRATASFFNRFLNASRHPLENLSLLFCTIHSIYNQLPKFSKPPS